MFAKLSIFTLFLLPLASYAAPLDRRLFEQTETHSFTQGINAPVDKVLGIMRDFPTFARLNPLVKDVKPNPKKADSFIVTDKVPLLGDILPLDFNYTVDATFTPDGLKSVVNAPLGVKLSDDWVVAPGPTNGTSVVTETVTVEATIFTMFTVTSNLNDSHKELLQDLAKLAESS